MKRIITGIIAIIAIANIPLHAQKKWTLEECIHHATLHNIAVRQTEIQRQNAQINLNTAQMSRLPDLNVSAGQDWSFGRAPTQTGLYENQNQSNTSASISSSIPIFTGFRISNQIKQSRLELEAATHNLEKAKDDLALNIAYLYLEVLFKQELLALSKQQATLSKDQVARTQALIDAGKAPLSQLYDIEAQVAKDEVSVIEAHNNLKLALLDLAQSLELEHDTGFDIHIPLTNNVIQQYTASVQPVDLVYTNALNAKPAIKVQEALVQSSHKELAIAQAGYYPSLSLSLSAGTSYYHIYGAQNESFTSQLKDKMGENIRLNLAIPIFNRYTVRNQVRSARLGIINQELTLENTRKALYKDIQTAYLNATASREKYQAAEKAVKASEESFAYAQERYNIGKSTVFEFDEAKNRLIQTQSEALQAKYDYIFRAKILDFYNGTPIEL